MSLPRLFLAAATIRGRMAASLAPYTWDIFFFSIFWLNFKCFSIFNQFRCRHSITYHLKILSVVVFSSLTQPKELWWWCDKECLLSRWCSFNKNHHLNWPLLFSYAVSHSRWTSLPLNWKVKHKSYFLVIIVFDISFTVTLPCCSKWTNITWQA